MDKIYLVKSNGAVKGFDFFSEDEYKNEVKDFFKRAKEKKGCVVCYDSDEVGYIFAERILYELKNASIINIDQKAFLIEQFGKHYGETFYRLYDKEDDGVSENYDTCYHYYKDDELEKLTLKDFGIEED